MDLNQFIQNNTLLKGTKKDDLSYSIKHFNKGSMIYQLGDKSTSLDFILEGEAIIQHINYEGQLITLTSFTQGSTIGGNRMFSSNSLFPMTITAVKDVTLLRLDKTTVIALCQKYESFLTHFLEDVANKNDILSKRFKSLSFMSIEDKIIQFLKNQYHISNSPIITLPFTKKEWAELMGVQRTSLSRALQKMKKNGFLDYKNKTISLVKLEFFV